MRTGMVFIFSQDVWIVLMRSFDLVMQQTAYLVWAPKRIKSKTTPLWHFKLITISKHVSQHIFISLKQMQPNKYNWLEFYSGKSAELATGKLDSCQGSIVNFGSQSLWTCLSPPWSEMGWATWTSSSATLWLDSAAVLYMVESLTLTKESDIFYPW